MPDDLETASADLHLATPPGWQVRRPSSHDEVGPWEQYAWDATESSVVGQRTGSGGG